MLESVLLLNFFDIAFYMIIILLNVLWVISSSKKEKVKLNIDNNKLKNFNSDIINNNVISDNIDLENKRNLVNYIDWESEKKENQISKTINQNNNNDYQSNLFFNKISINFLNFRFSSSILICLNLIYLIFFTYLWGMTIEINSMLWISALNGNLTYHLIIISIFSSLFIIYLNQNIFNKTPNAKKVLFLIIGQALTFSIAILYRYRFLEYNITIGSVPSYQSPSSSSSSSSSSFSFSFSSFFDFLFNADFSSAELPLSIIITVFSWCLFFSLISFAFLVFYQKAKKSINLQIRRKSNN